MFPGRDVLTVPLGILHVGMESHGPLWVSRVRYFGDVDRGLSTLTPILVDPTGKGGEEVSDQDHIGNGSYFGSCISRSIFDFGGATKT